MPFEKKGTLKLRCGGVNLRIRQNSDLCRLMNFKKPISYGVVFSSRFGNNLLNSYYCASIMQVLTGQYSTLYTYKFRIFYTDFQPNATRRSLINLVNLPKTVQIVSSAFWTESQFLDGAGSDISVALWDSTNVAAVGTSTGNFNNYRVSLPSTTDNGGFQAQVIRTKPTVPTSQQLFCHFLTPTQVQLSVTMPAGRSVNQLNQGTVLVWITTMKMP